MRFKRPQRDGVSLVGRENPDAKSACIGRLLLRMLIHKELQIPYKEIKLARTKEGKPYLENPSTLFPNFNFNVSHHSHWVVLASEPHDLIGVDVMDMKVPRRQKDADVAEFFNTMKHCFTPLEWNNIRYVNDVNSQEKQFFRHWALKESYIKAVGIGLGFELQRAEFTLDNNHNGSLATVRIDKKERPEWKFYLDYPDNWHVVACATGPPSEAVETFKKTLTKPTDNTITATHSNIPFKSLKLEDLIPQYK